MPATDVITQARLKELLYYDTETGDFTWLTDKGRAKKGTVTGCLTPYGYLSIRIDGVTHQAHRLAFLYMEGYTPKEVDHDNHIRHDNRWKNLNAATSTENSKNQTLRCDNTSGHVGVSLYKRSGKWRARTMINQKGIFLGYFTNKQDAIAARQAADIKYDFHQNHGSIKL